MEHGYGVGGDKGFPKAGGGFDGVTNPGPSGGFDYVDGHDLLLYGGSMKKSNKGVLMVSKCGHLDLYQTFASLTYTLVTIDGLTCWFCLGSHKGSANDTPTASQLRGGWGEK